MSLQSILSVVIFLCVQESFTRYASLNIGLNISAHFSDESSQLTEQLVRICMKETQLSMADLYRFKTNEIQDTEVNESTQCFAHCIYEQMGIMRNGLFIDNDDSQKLPADSVVTSEDFVVCKSIRGQNKCETAYKIHQCIQKVKYGGTPPTHDQAVSANSDTNTSRNDENDEDDSADTQNGQ